MEQPSSHDAWNAGNSYETYMGRWSREVANEFLDWLDPGEDQTWLDIGCGTGALTATILSNCAPRGVIGVEPSAGFLAHARESIADPRADFREGDATALPVADDECDVTVSALVLNFVPDKARALAEMQRVTRPGGTIAFYVWDYPGGGMGFIDAFWRAAGALDAAAQALDEGRRFPQCTASDLKALVSTAGMAGVEVRAIEVPTVFRDMDDFWRPFTLGAGPAPGYCMSLDEVRRQALRERVASDLPRAADGSIALSARAWAVKTVTH